MNRTLIFFSVILSLLLISSNVRAQKWEDVIYVKDGSIIHGQIVTDSIKSKVRILNHSGDILVFATQRIDSITREKPFEYKAFIFNQPGSEFIIEGALLIRTGNNTIDKPVIPGFAIGYSYRFQPYFSAGTSMGIEFYEEMEVPLSGFVKFRSPRKNVAPVFYFGTGYTLPTEKNRTDWDYSYKASGGIHVTTGIGIEKILSENSSVTFGFTYHYQELNYHLTPQHQWVLVRDRKEIYNRFKLSLGYVFK